MAACQKICSLKRPLATMFSGYLFGIPFGRPHVMPFRYTLFEQYFRYTMSNRRPSVRHTIRDTFGILSGYPGAHFERGGTLFRDSLRDTLSGYPFGIPFRDTCSGYLAADLATIPCRRPLLNDKQPYIYIYIYICAHI